MSENKKNKKKKKKVRSKNRRASSNFVVLDVFTQPDLDAWANQGKKLQSLADRVYFELEQQRAKSYDALCDSLRATPAVAMDVEGWARVTDWRWNMTPLSGAGSLKGIGARFNIGNDLDRARTQAFPCLYLAQDVETAFGEYFGGPLTTAKAPLSLGEFALRRNSSFTTFLLGGHLEQVFDLRTEGSLKAFANITNAFDISSLTKAAIRAAGLPPRRIIGSTNELWHWLLDEDCASYRTWILQVVAEVWRVFAAEFSLLWRTERNGILGGKDLFELQDDSGGAEIVLQSTLEAIWQDTLGYAGLEMHRRILGFAHVADFEAIADDAVRAACARQALAAGRQMVVCRRLLTTVAQANDLVAGQVMAC